MRGNVGSEFMYYIVRIQEKIAYHEPISSQKFHLWQQHRSLRKSRQTIRQPPQPPDQQNPPGPGTGAPASGCDL